MSSLYNTPTDTAMRLLLILREKGESLSQGHLLAIDFVATFGLTFGIAGTNLHGNSYLNLAEFPARKNLVSNAIRYLVTNALIDINETSSGFLFSLNKTGEEIICRISGNYMEEYRSVACSAIRLYASMPDSEIIQFVQNYHLKQEDGI